MVYNFKIIAIHKYILSIINIFFPLFFIYILKTNHFKIFFFFYELPSITYP